ncbi:MAG: DUF4255 domain-containing protein [Comamonadaceae bacterium]|nr:DUF4255 domain-containing protein [Comamonadaceae bacterium]
MLDAKPISRARNAGRRRSSSTCAWRRTQATPPRASPAGGWGRLRRSSARWPRRWITWSSCAWCSGGPPRTGASTSGSDRRCSPSRSGPEGVNAPRSRMYTSIIAASESLRELLRASFRADLGPSGLAGFFGGTMDVSLATPREMQGSQQGLSMWLYRVVRDDTRLNDPPRRRPLPGGGVELVPPPLPLRLHYLMTPLVDDGPETEQRILGRVLQLFHMHPVLSGADLRGDLTGTPAQIHVRLEALSLDETSRVWEALDGAFQLSVSYEVSLANIDDGVQPLRAPLVESAHAGHAIVVGEPA